METNIVIDIHHQSESRIWQNSDSRVMGWNVADQSNCGIL